MKVMEKEKECIPPYKVVNVLILIIPDEHDSIS
jgi:hypothetical protein